MGKIARNEQKKLIATTLNGIAVGIVSATTISLGTRLLSGSLWWVSVVVVVVGALHVLARAVLGRLEE